MVEFNRKKEILGIIVLVLIIGSIVGWRWYTSTFLLPSSLLEDIEREAEDAVLDREEPAIIMIHVAGAVKNPGVYSLLPGARASDAVAAAGGPLPEADEHAFNLAQPLYDGQRIAIPFKVGVSLPSGVSAVPLCTRININTASVSELETLPGIGPARAADIVKYREQQGFFKNIEELTEISGIGPKTLENLRNLITIY